ncbi:MAG TPA: TIGR03084 family metal-binding protein [Acidimicrobiia bacterium]|nr:TIGR03084 family metal-binding protein [Acidimicrobiia bacterium]
MRELLTDLASEQQGLDELVAALPAQQWDLITPAEPWTIRDTISHLAFFDERQTEAITDPVAFQTELNTRLAGVNEDYMSIGIDRGRVLEPSGVLAWWRQARARELAAFTTVGADTQLPWYGPAMKAASAVTARLMETWAHGQDVADALGITRSPTDRLLHIAELGVKTFSWSFLNRGLEVPPTRVRVVLTAPSGVVKIWNEHVESDRTSGPVEDFCLVVAQRRHLCDTSLEVEGEIARRWMEGAQIFAGPPGPGRPRTSGNRLLPKESGTA